MGGKSSCRSSSPLTELAAGITAWLGPVMVERGRPVPGRWTAAAYTCLMVALYVAEPAVVNLTVHDHLQLDRVTGTSAERHGDLVPPGTTPVHLAAGTYVFRTTGDAQVQPNEGAAVEVTAVHSLSDKDKWPDPPPAVTTPLPAARGDGPPDYVPTLTVLR
jgi:hypothetical protein